MNDVLKDRLAALRAESELLDVEQESKELERKVKRAERELEVKKLRKRLEEELGGAEGEAFAIVDTIPGVIGLKLGAPVLYKRYMSAKRVNELPTLETMAAFVSPCIAHPEKQVVDQWADVHGGIYMACTAALVPLFEGKRAEDTGK